MNERKERSRTRKRLDEENVNGRMFSVVTNPAQV